MILLFVDTNVPLLETRTSFLRERLPGFTVVPFADPDKAAAWLTTANALNVLVTEAIFDTDHSGFALRDAAEKRFPHVRVLFTTRFDLTGFEAQIGKSPVLKDGPYPLEKLVERVQTLFAAVDASTPPPVMVPGTVLGNYQVLDRLYIERESETYRALQITVQRPVALVLLKPEFLQQPEIVAKFKDRIRVKASLTFPRIAPLYEAGEVDRWLFYTRELPRGRTVEAIEESGERLSERRLAEALFGIAAAMQHATAHDYHYRTLGPRDVYIDAEHQASITNIFRPRVAKQRDVRADVRGLLAMLRPIAADGKARGLLDTLSAKNYDWNQLLEALDDIRDDMREHSIVKKIEAESLPRVAVSGNRPWWVWAVCAGILIAAVIFGAMSNGLSDALAIGKDSPQHPEWVHVPAGPFKYQKNEKRVLPEYWIGKHEVTIGQYDEFLRALKKLPSGSVDHPDQPKTKTDHTPPNWGAYIAAAKSGAVFNGEPISLNTPVTQVDWFDAWSYAKWRGQRLPTEEEWEKAARGDKGLSFPWGNKAEPGAANLGDDYSSTDDVKGGQIDGYNVSAPTSRETEDVSPYGACDMAGNVREWTASETRNGAWPTHPDYPDVRVPAVRGGHFGLKSNDKLLTARLFPESALETSVARGFRVASDSAP